MLPVTTRPLTHVPIRARLDLDSTYLDLLWPLLVMSAGLGLCTAPAPAAIIAGTPVEKHGVAAAVNDAARGVGAAIGIGIAGSILVAGYSNRIEPALPRLPEQARGPSPTRWPRPYTERIGPQAKPLADFAKAAFIHGAQQASLALGFMTVIAAVLAAAWAPGRPAHEHTGIFREPYRTSNRRAPDGVEHVRRPTTRYVRSGFPSTIFRL